MSPLENSEKNKFTLKKNIETQLYFLKHHLGELEELFNELKKRK